MQNLKGLRSIYVFIVLEERCKQIVDKGFMLRLSLNMNSAYNTVEYEYFFREANR